MTGRIPDIPVQLRPLIPKKLLRFSSNQVKATRLILTDRGDVLYYYDSKVTLTDTHMTRTKASLTNCSVVVSLAQCKDHVFLAFYGNRSLTCERFSYELVKKADICQFSTEHPSYHHMVVRDEEVIIIDNSSYSYNLRIYDFSGNQIRSVSLDSASSRLCLLPDGYILLRNASGFIVKYDITSSKATRVWTSKEPYNFVSTDSAGICYCNSNGYENDFRKIEMNVYVRTY